LEFEEWRLRGLKGMRIKKKWGLISRFAKEV
jgi:hypothetical protein